MGIFSSVSEAIQATTRPVIRAANAVDESLAMATVYIHNRSVVFQDEDMAVVATASAKRQAKLKHELEDDDDAALIYEALIAKMSA